MSDEMETKKRRDTVIEAAAMKVLTLNRPRALMYHLLRDGQTLLHDACDGYTISHGGEDLMRVEILGVNKFSVEIL